MNEVPVFSCLDFIQRLRAFRECQHPGAMYVLKCLRVPGEEYPRLVEYLSKPDGTEDEEIIGAWNIEDMVQEEMDQEQMRARLIQVAVVDAFDLPQLDLETGEYGDLEAEDLFVDFLYRGFQMLKQNNYFEMHLAFSRLEDGFECSVTLNRTGWTAPLGETVPVQINTVLIQMAYPLCAAEATESEAE